MQFFPNRGIFLQIGDNIAIRWYAVLIVTGAVLAYMFGNYEAKKAGYDDDVFDDIFVGCLVFGVIGARLWFCIFYDFEGYFSNPASIFRIWDGGLAIHGGLTFGALFFLWYCHKKRYSFLHLADITLPNVLIAQAIGRWGNFCNQEAFGNVVDESYFDGILSFIKNGMYISGQYRQPMFFFESCLCILGFVLIKLYRKYSKPTRGSGVFCYLAWYGAIRFWIESQRTDALFLGDIRIAQLTSLIFLIIGVAGLCGAFKKLINKKKPVVIFDLDGTLLDTHVVIEKSFAHVFAKYKPELVLTDEIKASFLGPTIQDSFRRYIPEASEAQIEEMTEMYRKHNVEHHKEYVVAFPHVKELLDYLKENGYRFAIASSKIKPTIELGLECTGLRDYFDIIIGVEEITCPKPNKETIVKALDALNAEFVNAIYVGDAATDIQAAKNAGVYSIAYCTNELKRQSLIDNKPNNLIDDILEIKDILQEEHSWSSNMM